MRSRCGGQLSRMRRGFSLIETLMAVVIVGVALAGVLSAFRVAVGRSADPLIVKQLLSIAESMMEEVMLRPYTPADNPAAAGCARDTFNDVDDYQGYATTGQICGPDGTVLPALAGYSVSVSVQPGTFGGITDAKRIVVTATRGSESIQLSGWKTDLSMP